MSDAITQGCRLAVLIDRFGVDVLAGHDRQAEIPVLAGLQVQGDVAVVPAPGRDTSAADDGVPASGIVVAVGVSGGHAHTLLADDDRVRWLPREAYRRFASSPLAVGMLLVPPGTVAYLAHPEHSYTGIAPGQYEVRRQRELTLTTARPRTVLD